MKNSRLFLLSIILALPLVAFLIHYYTAHAPGLIPTGFIQDDDVVYVSNARQHIEGKLSLTYSNPFSSPSSPSIYSQPYNFLLSFFLYLKFKPGFVISIFGLISAIACVFFFIETGKSFISKIAIPKHCFSTSYLGWWRNSHCGFNCESNDT